MSISCILGTVLSKYLEYLILVHAYSPIVR